MRTISPSALLLSALLWLQPAAGSAQITETPKAVAQAYLNAFSATDWATVLRLTDSPSRWEFVTMQRRQWREYRKQPQEAQTVEFYLRSDSTMPRAVAEYYVRQNAKFAASASAASAFQYAIADVDRLTQLDSLTDDELYIRILRARTPEYILSAATRAAGCPPSRDPLPRDSNVVRGVALLTETRAVALYETHGLFTPPPTFRPELHQLELVRTSAGWRVHADVPTTGAQAFAVVESGEGCANAAGRR